MTSNVLLKLAGQGNVYVRSLTNVNESDDDVNIDELLTHPAFATVNVPSVHVNRSASFTEDLNNWPGYEITINESDFGRDNETSNDMTNWTGGTCLSAVTSQPPMATHQLLSSVPPVIASTVHDSNVITADDPDGSQAVEDPDLPIVVDDPDSPIAIDGPDSPTAIDDPDPFIIKVHRTMIRQDLINTFSDESIMSKPLVGIMVNSRGEEDNVRGTL
jgi:hypothetical protein